MGLMTEEQIQRIVYSVADIEGWLTPDEATLLAKAAADHYEKTRWGGTWVEIGSYCGKSTCLLGQVILTGNSPIRLYAIDPHEGELSYPGSFDLNGRYIPRNANSKEPKTFEQFIHNIESFNLEHTIYVINKKSTDVTWDIQLGDRGDPDPIDLIFIDGLHDYDSVKADYFHFRPYLSHHALVIFHDYTDWAGVNQAVNEFVGSGDLKIIAQADSLVVCKHLKENSE